MTEQEQNQTFTDWLGQYKALLFKVVRAYAVPIMDQDDLLQEILIQVWHSIPTFKQQSSSTTWVYRIALNTAIKWSTKERKHTDARETIETVQPMLQEPSAQPDERISWLYDEIHQLNEVDRSLCLLFLDGFSYKEMATILGISESNIGVKINRIKKQLITKSKQPNHYGI
ncbi:RNA polymerase sigma factor [Fibrella forsythiae]|uniref:Sigma-70 family RNA polymerase sigma factor n=1 Tax=Fibrella forsythiae TaxID=2817061 RepID=A0ABS3JM58_9BACT|nr:sigma-70 family RNA polymerase sigma factor [Fibrella forsythiae]MBO0951097.1 sigma-70 family RNA polymerase sigma factor [Fibrella forsythiae]